MREVRDDDRGAKYIRLFGTILFSFLAFIASLVLVIFLLQLIFGFLNKFSVTEFIYNLFIIMVPASFFITVAVYYWKRTKTFPRKAVKYISYFIFSVIIAAWSYALVRDVIAFFKLGNADIKNYQSFELYMLAGSVGLIFLTGIIQALALPDEGDWMSRGKG